VVRPVHLHRFSYPQIIFIAFKSPAGGRCHVLVFPALPALMGKRRNRPCPIFGSFPLHSAPNLRYALAVPDSEHAYYTISRPIPSIFFASSNVYRLYTM